MNTVIFRDLGRVDYARAWAQQRTLHDARVAGTGSDYLLFCEHEPVVTMGKSGKRQNLLVAAAELERRGIAYYEVERGGDLTYHGPGQLVGYPIFKLARLREVQAFVRKMEESLIRALTEFGVIGERRSDHAGVFVRGAKIASIGAAVQGGVTFHGFALDVCTDLNYFNVINPCGMPGIGLTSIAQECGREVTLGEAKPIVRKAMADVFEWKLDEERIAS